MKNILLHQSFKTMQTSFAVLSIFFAGNAVRAAEIDPEMLIVPGKALGLIKIGSKPDQVHKAFASCDGRYDLKDGYTAEFYEWKEPEENFYVRVYYDRSGKVVQVSSQAIKPETADHITIKSTLSDIQKLYKSLKTTSYKGKEGLIDYHDDVAQGICFESAGAKSKDAKMENCSL